jgi:L-ascorbate metabolism protein UlaG (beta-lactamase superfamily)
MHAPPIALADLSGIDAVLISHDHYDHLDMQTIQHLAAQGTQFYVGLGIGAHLERWKVAPTQIHEMDCGAPSLALICRFFGRAVSQSRIRQLVHTGLDGASLRAICEGGNELGLSARAVKSSSGNLQQRTLWASWVVKGAQHSFYYSGDTGYADHFREIRAKLGDTDLNLIKVGAYGMPPSWLDIHMDPESAVRANQDLGGGILLPVHWATFNLSYHAWDEPILRTLRAAAAAQVQVVTPRVGEVVEIGQPFSNVEWYKPAR